MKNFEQLNRRLITFSAISLLFIGSMFYFISMAFRGAKGIANTKQNQDIIRYLDELNGTDKI